jgi:hypothetical protein
MIKLKAYSDPRNTQFEDIMDLQPMLNKICTSNPYKIAHMSCFICRFFAVNPRQCPVCDTLTCAHCANADHDDPHLCKACLKNAVLNSVLNTPGDLKGKISDMRARVAQFDCPYRCGEIDFNLQ